MKVSKAQGAYLISDADAQFIRCHRPEGYGAGGVRQDARKGRLCHQVAEHYQFPLLTKDAVLFLLSVKQSTIKAVPAGPYPS